jgi:hypothetical protein
MKLKEIPKFETEDEEREFWATHDTTEYMDWSEAEEIEFPNLIPSQNDIRETDPKPNPAPPDRRGADPETG